MIARFLRRCPAALLLTMAPCLLARAAPSGEAALTVDGETWTATPLAHDDFTDPDWGKRWVLEGNATVEARDGKLSVVTAKSKQVEQVATVWWREALPADVLIELTARATGPIEDNAANVNLFFHARELGGGPYRFGRSGRYADYHTIPNYITTLTGGFQEGWARMRRNPGFNLISEDKTLRSEVGGAYHIRVVIAGGRLRQWINGRLVHDARDPDPLPGGHFALRTWRSHILWSDVKISALTRAGTTAHASTQPSQARGQAIASPATGVGSSGLEFIDTSFENASPLWYDAGEDGSIQVHLLYDHERASPNRATGHFHFLLQGKPGTRLTIEFRNVDNVWNGQPSSMARNMRAAVVSEDGRSWTSVPMENLPNNRVRMTVEMPGPRLYVARVEPYRISDLDKFLDSIRADPRVEIAPIGHTVQGRELEIVRVGDPDAPYRVFVRARAHPWEPGGNWVAQGLIRRLLKDDADARRFLERYCLYVMPMANKDGVALGRTRFNMKGKDLNRDLHRPADPELAPENAAMESWLEGMIAAGRQPHLALELHNDAGGRLHLARSDVPELPRYLERMEILETLLRKHTWFTEGTTPPSFHNTGALASAWLERYQIDGVTHEFNANWIAGLGTPPLGKHWEQYGSDLARVLWEYFEAWPATVSHGGG